MASMRRAYHHILNGGEYKLTKATIEAWIQHLEGLQMENDYFKQKLGERDDPLQGHDLLRE